MTTQMLQPKNYEMFTKEGNRRVSYFVEKIKIEINNWSDSFLYRELTQEMDRAMYDGYPEVWDTVVRENIIGELERHTGRNLTIYWF